ncbi:MAG: FAD:protein FMN transferase, partial [Gammaproteobacteria bacterium]
MIARLAYQFLFVAATLLLVTACERKPEIHGDQLEVLGASAQITIAGMTPDDAMKVTRAAAEDLKALDRIGYTFGQEGELYRLNDAIARGKAMEVGTYLLELLQHAINLSVTSQGLFNPAAGEFTALWEFHCDKDECTEPTYSDEVQRLVKEQLSNVMSSHPSMLDLRIAGNRVSSKNPRVKLEFGDIIRGFALDKSIDHLKRVGVENAMVNIGGNVHAVGTRGDHAWWVGVPDVTGKHHIGYIETDGDEAVFTVRAFDRSLGKEDSIYRHIVDPRTGLPVNHIQSVTVLHENAMIANAAAAALIVADTDNWKTIADSMNVHAFLMISRDGIIYT